MLVPPDAIHRLQTDLVRDLLGFLPELILIGSIMAILFLKLFGVFRGAHMGGLALLSGLAAFAAAVAPWAGYAPLDPRPEGSSSFNLFANMIVFDSFAGAARIFLLAFLCLVLVLTKLTGIPDPEDSGDFSTLLLGSTLGMMLMTSANHLLMVFLAVEMASVPSYVLAGFLKGKRSGSEAALKYVVYGASASGVMLYGISLLAGEFGTGYLPDVAIGFQTTVIQSGDPVIIAGALFVLVGLAFKLAAVPFHFWCPDVFEGAAAEVAGFLSVASKGAALTLTVRIMLMLAGPVGTQAHGMMLGWMGMLLAVLATATATLGNLAALGQTNLKRLLAYSTIAHAGYMLMALVPLSTAGAGAVLFYLAAYLLMNLGAFASVAFIRNAAGSEDLSKCAGLVYRAPWLVVSLAIFLFSLLGMPPFAGFAAKFQVFAVLYDTGRVYSGTTYDSLFKWLFYGLLAVAAINTVVSAAYYLKVLRVMILDTPEAGSERVRVPAGATIYTLVLAIGVVLAGVMWEPLSRATNYAAAIFNNKSATTTKVVEHGR